MNSPAAVAAGSVPPSPASAPWRGIGALTLLRFAGDTAIRAPVPFVIFIAAAYGAPPESAGWLAVALGMAGLISPLASVIERRLGSRRSILISAALFSLSCFALAIAPTFGAALLLCVVLSLGRSLIGPQAQAYVADSVPFERRGAALGVLELAWALSWVLGVPMFGFLVQRAAWWLPFWVIGVIALAGTWAVLRFAITHDHARALATRVKPDGIASLLRHGPARRVLILGFGIVLSMHAAILVYAPYLVSRYDLSAEQLGLISIVLGIADILAEMLIIFALDRIGKRRSVLLGCGLMAIGFVAFLGAASLALSIGALFVVFLGFEYAIVSTLPITTEVLPSSRIAMAGSFAGVTAAARTIAALIAIPLFLRAGLGGVIALSLTALTVAVAAFWAVRIDSAPRRLDVAH